MKLQRQSNPVQFEILRASANEKGNGRYDHHHDIFRGKKY